MVLAHAIAQPPRPLSRVSVLLPLPLPGAFDYCLAPGAAPPVPGSFVTVPLGRREVTGVVWDAVPATGKAVAVEKLKPVVGMLDAPPLPTASRRFVDWVARYTLSPPGAVLRMVMSVPAALTPPAARIAYIAAASPPESLRLTDARKRVLAGLADGAPRLPDILARESNVGRAVIRGLIEAGALVAVSATPPPPFDIPDWQRAGPDLSSHQAAAVAKMIAGIDAGGFEVNLLDGVTGSGKTEVYFEAIARVLAAGRQVLVLLPEIALSAQWLDRFAARFGAAPAIWHSDLGARQRRVTWRAVAEGRAPVVVGARSALFLPYPDLGLIVVDEEHDPSYKQEEGVIYNARDMAVVRARLSEISVALVSATPSLESVINAETGRYHTLHLPDRHGGADMPVIEVIDMRADPPARQNWLSPVLKRALTETFAAGEQAMLFLNRRGYAPLTLCRTCGHRLQCPNCTAWLVEHRHAATLQCHHCGHKVRAPDVCPECGSEDSLAVCGPGVERLAEEVRASFPDVRFDIMASDTLSGPEAVASLVRRVGDHDLDLLIGTQVMAKGHHFPLLTLVGVVDADLGLSGGDLRAAERTYQLLAQVAGRAGREAHKGRVYLQTYMPEHPVMRALISGERDQFLQMEANARRAHGMPPFGRLAAVIVSGIHEGKVESAARALGRAAPHGDGVAVLGPAPAPLAILRRRYRRRLLLKGRRDTNIQAVLRDWIARVRIGADVRVQVDIDPYSFM